METKEKKKITFGHILLGYAGLWLIITAILCIVLYSKFAAYQASYDSALAASNPDNYISNYLYLFDSEHITELSVSLKEAISDLEYQENIDAYVISQVENCSVSFNRCPDFKENKPLYYITADGKDIGSVILKQSSDVDSFGFRGYELSESSLLIDLPELNSYTVNVIKGDKLIVNGTDITDSHDFSSNAVSSFMDDEASERTEITHYINTYTLTGLMYAPEVEIQRDGKTINLELSDDSVYENIKLYDDEFLSLVEDRVLATGEAYINNMNRYGSFANVSAYLVYYGKAYNSILAAQQGIGWAGAPEEFYITSKEITDMVQYGDECFVATTHYEFYRLYRGVEYNEEMTLKWLFIKSGEYWYALDMTLGN